MTTKQSAGKVPALPHSWGLSKWPPDVYPGKPSKGRYLVRTNYDALMACGAVTRIGREVVVLGAGWASFLAKGASKVKDFDATARMNEANARRRAEAAGG